MVTGHQLVLVGPPAAGKSTLGRAVAGQVGAEFTDTDELLVTELGLSLPEAWASMPPERIAAAETAICLASLERPGLIALGSAAVARPEVRAALAGRPVVWLQVSAAQASRRLGMAALGMETLVAVRSRLAALLRERDPWYSEVATVRIDTDRLDVARAVDRVRQAWEDDAW